MKNLFLIIAIEVFLGVFCYSQDQSELHAIDITITEGNYLKTIQTCRKALIKDSLNAEIWFKYAVACQSLYKFEDAEEALLKAAKISPKIIKYRQVLGDVYLDMGLNGPAEKVYRDLFRADSSNYQAALNLAAICYQSNKSREALDIYTFLYKQDSTNYILLNKIANCWVKMGKNRKAITTYKNSIKINDLNIPTYKSISYIYYRLNKQDTARIYLDAAIKIDSADADLYRRRGDCYFADNYYLRSNRDYSRVLKSGDSSVIILKRLGIGHNSGKMYKEALDLLLLAHKKDTTDAETCQHLGFALRMLNRLDESLIYYQKVLAIKQSELYYVGDIYEDIGYGYDLKYDFPKAMSNYKHALNLMQESFSKYTLYYRMAKISDENLKDYKSAAYYYQNHLDKAKNLNLILDEDYEKKIKNYIAWLNKKTYEKK